ncbi:MAG: hypothetical protein LVQ95_04610 [Candidatus Micrarchaeales archaeon]|nr:hypothetical protein [Candidatus Micrarchaeales archaeon]
MSMEGNWNSKRNSTSGAVDVARRLERTSPVESTGLNFHQILKEGYDAGYKKVELICHSAQGAELLSLIDYAKELGFEQVMISASSELISGLSIRFLPI